MRIVVIGDVMQDIDIHCQIVKHYDQAPVLKELWEDRRLGGAGNVAEMCRALKVETLLLGNDPSRIVKRRLLSDGRLIARHDTEESIYPGFAFTGQQAIQFQPDAIIVADHGKGFVSNSNWMMETLPKVPIFIDPFHTTPVIVGDHITWIGSEKEIPPDASGRRIIKQGSNGLVFLTNGEFDQPINLPSECVNCVDDIGAGDQFIVCLAIARLKGMSWLDAITRANRAAGQQCQRPGIQPLQEQEF